MNEERGNIPFGADIESKRVLRALARAHRALAELNGVAESIPNEIIIVNTLSLQEAKDSSAIENIITTHDEIFSSDTIAMQFRSSAAKEVHNYASALLAGFGLVRERGMLTCNQIIEIQAILEETKAGFRRLPGTTLKNEQTGEIIYTPPQSYDEILRAMTELERFINDEIKSEWDSIVKMAVIHHRFESIHPFYDGNGRTGRIVNILYLVKEGLLNLPILYLSRFINENKAEYYRLLQETRESGECEEWLMFMIKAVEETALQTSGMVRGIHKIMAEYKRKIRSELPNIYSQDLINNLFKHPYTKIEFLVKDLGVSRQTASKYLERLVSIGLLSLQKVGKENYYVNTAFFDYLLHAPEKLKTSGRVKKSGNM